MEIEVISVMATPTPEIFTLSLKITQRGETFPCTYLSAPNDPHGINPYLREWLASNTYTIIPHGEVV